MAAPPRQGEAVFRGWKQKKQKEAKGTEPFASHVGLIATSSRPPQPVSAYTDCSRAQW